MAVPTDRDTFKDYCLRALGDGVLQINISDEQAEDRIDEALYLYQEYHMDAVQKDYMKHQFTASLMRFTGAASNTFQSGEVIHGNTSNANGIVFGTPANTTSLSFYNISGNLFQEGETVNGMTSGATATIAAANANTEITGIVLGSYDLKYIDIPQGIIYVKQIFPPFDSRLSAEILFDPMSQFNISLLSSFTSNSIIPYVMGRQYQSLLNETFRGRPAIRFQRHQNRLYIDLNFKVNFQPGWWTVIECFRVLDPDTWTDVWSDRWLQRYSIALMKRQWGTNLSKYNGIALPGNVTLDGRTMLTEANQEVKDLEEELKSTYQLPIDFMVG